LLLASAALDFSVGFQLFEVSQQGIQVHSYLENSQAFFADLRLIKCGQEAGAGKL